jgi:SAM-dependent methyltransferase
MGTNTAGERWASDSWGSLDAESPDEVDKRSGLIDTQSELPPFRETRAFLLEAVHADRTSTLVELGCGPLPYLEQTMAALGSEGRWIALDSTTAFIEEGRRRAAAAGWENVELHVGDARALPFADESASAAIADKLLIHVAPLSQVVSEMVRVTRRGGWVGACDADADGMLILASDLARTREILRVNADGRPSPRAASQTAAVLHDCGLTDIGRRSFLATMQDPREPFVERLVRHWAGRTVSAGVITAEEAAEWVADVMSYATKHALLVGFPLIVSWGRRR